MKSGWDNAMGEIKPARVAMLFVVFLAIGLFVAYLNRGHVEQQTIFWGHYVPMAEHYRSGATRDVLTYPLWGYPFMLLVFGPTSLVGAQVLLGAVVMTALLLRLCRELPDRGLALTILFVAALPWYLLHSVKWPQSIAASLLILGLLLLERTCRTSSIGPAVAAGFVFGCALYFRSEFLYFQLFLVVAVVLASKIVKVPLVPLRATIISALTSLLVLLPWAIHFYRETGRISFRASNGGMVAFVSLGQLPGNPWGASFRDEYAYEYLKNRGVAYSALSSEGDLVLFDEFKRRVQAEPYAFGRKIIRNAIVTVIGGFYNGELPLSPNESEQVARLRQSFKALVTSPVETVEGPFTARVYSAFAYWVALKALGALFVLVSLAGLLASLVRPKPSPLLFLLALLVIYQLLLLVFLSTEPRHLNGLFPALVPFFVVALSQLPRLKIAKPWTVHSVRNGSLRAVTFNGLLRPVLAR